MKPSDRFWRCLIVAAAICLSLTAQGKAPSQMDLLDDRRSMRVGDYLVYQVLEEREPPQIVFVNDRGRVDLPLIDEIEAAGKTPRQLAFLIKEELERTFFHRATVLVQFQHGQNSRGRINLVGRVARPGPVNIPADEVLTVSAAITRAGSILPGADLSRVELVRDNAENSGEEERLIVDVRDVLEFGNLAADVIVRPNDIIIVPESRSAGGRFYVTGMVNREGVYTLPASGEKLTVSEAILNAGGFRQYASKDAVQVVRADPELPDAQRKLRVNVEAILRGREVETDVEVRPGDIIHVREVFFSW